MALRIGFDLDGTLADMEGELIRQAEVLFGQPMARPIDSRAAAADINPAFAGGAPGAAPAEGAADNEPPLLKLKLTKRQQSRLWVFVQTGLRYQSNATFTPSSNLIFDGDPNNPVPIDLTGPHGADWNWFGLAQVAHDLDFGNQRGDKLETRFSGYLTRQFQLTALDVGLVSGEAVDDEITVLLALVGGEQRRAALLDAQHDHLDAGRGREVAASEVMRDLQREPRLQQRRVQILARDAAELLGGLTLHDEVGILWRAGGAGQPRDNLVRAGEGDAGEDFVWLLWQRMLQKIAGAGPFPEIAHMHFPLQP